MAVTRPARRRTLRPGPALVLTAVAPVLWFTHLAVMYALVPLSCRVGSDAPLHVTTAAAGAGLVASAAAVLRLAPDRSPRALLARMLGRHATHDRAAPLLAATALAIYFLGVVAVTGLTPLVVHRCA